MQDLLSKDQTIEERFDFTKDVFTHPTTSQEKILQQVIVSGLSENLCRIAPLFDAQGNEITVKSKDKVLYESQESSDRLQLHKLSSLYNSKPAHIVYQEVYATESPDGNKTTHYIKNATVVDNLAWLHQLCAPVLLSYSKPLTEDFLRQA